MTAPALDDLLARAEGLDAPRAIDEAYREGRAAPTRALIAQLSQAATPADPWERALAEALAEVQDALGRDPTRRKRRPMFQDASHILATNFGPTPWQVTGIATRGSTVVIGGEPKVSKSWLGVEMSIAIATGTAMCGEFPVARGRVAYFFAEDGARQIRNRVRALLASRGLDASAVAGRLHCCPRGESLDLMADEDLAWIVASARELGPVDMLVLDPLRDIHSGEEDKSDSMRDVMRRARVIGKLLDCTVTLVHHMNKSASDKKSRSSSSPGQGLRGSGAIRGSLDTGVYLLDPEGDRVQDFATSVAVEVKGARGAGKFSLRLLVEDDEHGEAVRAAWHVSREVVPGMIGKAAAPAPTGGSGVAELDHACARVLATVRGLRELGADATGRSQLVAKTDLSGMCKIQRVAAAAAIDKLVLGGFLVRRSESYQVVGAGTPAVTREATRQVLDLGPRASALETSQVAP